MKAHLFTFLLHVGITFALSKPATIAIYSKSQAVAPPLQSKTVSINAPEANAILSHHLGISKYESMPKSLSNGIKAQMVFGDHDDDDFVLGEGADQPRVVMVVYGAEFKDVAPTGMADTIQFQVWTPPPPAAWDSLFGIYIGRFVHAFDVPIASLFGVESFLSSHLHKAGMSEWAQDWENKVADWVKWGEQQLGIGQVKVQVMPKDTHSRWMTEYSVADASSKTLMQELASLDSHIETLSESRTPPLSMLRFAGLLEIERRYTFASRQYNGSVTLLQKMVAGAVGAILTDCPHCKIIFVSVPSAPLYSRNEKRTPASILASFKTSPQSFASRAMLNRRSEVFGQGKRAIKTPIVGSSRKCFDSASACESGTNTCNGHGTCVQGIRTVGGTCYVCQCGSTEDDVSGKRLSWSGEFCQKQDVSSDFVLLAGSTLGLLVLFAVSVALLVGVGAESLPQQLASVSGQSKKME